MKLFTYFRSTAAYRVRIALNLKGLTAEQQSVNLIKEGGEHHGQAYRDLNPQGLVPALATEAGVIAQSLAIIEYLEETHPQPALLPAEPFLRAQVRSLAYAIACDIHPLNNLRVLQYLENDLGVDADAKRAWYHHWVAVGFEGIEATLQKFAGQGDFCFGAEPSLADVCLVPQVFNAVRFECDLNPFPRIRQINDHCLKLKAFQDAAPENQPDAPAA